MDNLHRNPAQAHDGLIAQKLLLLAVWVGVALLPDMASASGGIEGVLCNVLDNLTGTTGAAIATVIVAGFGISSLLGKISWVVAVTVLFGVALLFGAGSIIIAMGGNGDACLDIGAVVINPGTFTGQNAIDFCNTHVEADGTPGGFYPNGTDKAPGNAIARPIVECFTDPDQGVIPSATEAFLASTQVYFVPIVGIMATLTVAIFGLKVLSGDIPRMKAESFILLFKVASVFFFLTSAPTIYTQLLAILGGLSDTISAASVSLDPNGFCNTSAGAGGTTVANDLWARWDCIIGKIFHFSKNQAPTGGIAAFLIQLLAGSSIGVIIFFVGVYCILALLFALVRFLYIYIMAVLAFSFMFVMGYLFVPMILFKSTHDYFQKWLNIILAYILMPVVLLGYMGMMLVLFDIVFYSGPNSVWNMTNPVDAGATANSDTNNVFETTATQHRKDQMYGMLYPDYGNIGVAQQDQVANTNAGIASSNMRYLRGITATQFMQTPAATAPAAGLDTTALDTDALGGNNYLTNLLTAFATAALLIYVMYSLLNYIPQMAAGLVSQSTSAGMIVKSAVFGEAMSFNMAGYAERIAGNMSSGGAGALRSAMGKMVGKR